MKHPIYCSLQNFLRSNVFFLILLVFICHGLVPLNNGVYIDDWIFYGLSLNRDVGTFLDLFREAGHDGHGYFHLAFWIFPNQILAYKIVAFSCILLATLLIYAMARRSRMLSSRESLFVAAIFCCYSAYQTHATIMMVPSIFFYTLFLLATYTALIAFERTTGKAILLRVLSLAMFAISFQMGSLLVFYFPILLFLFAMQQQPQLGGKIRALVIWGLRHCDFVLLPFVFWILKQRLLPPHGLYAGYNQPSYDPGQLLAYSRLFWEGAVTEQLINARMLFFSYPLVSAAFVGLSLFAATISGKFSDSKEADASTRPLEPTANPYISILYISLFSLFLFLCSIFPYVAVGKYATALGWGTRLSLLISLPIAIGLVAFGRILDLAAKRKLPKLALPLFASVLIAAFTLANIDAYIRLQARWIKDSSVIVKLRELPSKSIEQVRVLIVDDQYRIPSNDAGYTFYEYAGMFKLAWNEESRVGFVPNGIIDSAELIKKYPQRRYLLKDFRPGGCRVTLHIHPHSPRMSNAELVAEYFFKYRWSDPAKLHTFLQNVTVLSLTDLSCPDQERSGKKD